MTILTEYVGPTVVFVDGEKNSEAVRLLVEDFAALGVRVGLKPPLSGDKTDYELLLLLDEGCASGDVDIRISVSTEGRGYLPYRTESNEDRSCDFKRICRVLDDWQQKQPLWACILIGGKSSRMGTPKHLLIGASGKTWLEEKVELLLSFTSGVVLSGGGDVPQSLSQYERVEDAPDLVGPMAGILGIMQAYPTKSWLVCACDMPLVTEEAVSWLMAQRRFGQRAILPMREGIKKGHVGMYAEPLFACYEKSCRKNIEFLAQEGVLRISALVEQEGVFCPGIPKKYQDSWANINTPEEAERLKPLW